MDSNTSEAGQCLLCQMNETPPMDATRSTASPSVGKLLEDAPQFAREESTLFCSPCQHCPVWMWTQGHESLCSKLQVFCHSTIQRVLGANMSAVERGRMKNEHLWSKLSVCSIAELRRQSSCIGKHTCLDA